MLAAPLRREAGSRAAGIVPMVLTYRRAKSSIAATGSPVMRAAHSGVRVSGGRQLLPVVRVPVQVVEVGVAIAEQHVHDRAGEHPSVPGRNESTSASGACAVRSTTTSLRTERFAARTWVMTLTWVFTGLVPQITIRSECAISSPITCAGQPASTQIIWRRHADRGVFSRQHGVAAG